MIPSNCSCSWSAFTATAKAKTSLIQLLLSCHAAAWAQQQSASRHSVAFLQQTALPARRGQENWASSHFLRIPVQGTDLCHTFGDVWLTLAAPLWIPRSGQTMPLHWYHGTEIVPSAATGNVEGTVRCNFPVFRVSGEFWGKNGNGSEVPLDPQHSLSLCRLPCPTCCPRQLFASRKIQPGKIESGSRREEHAGDDMVCLSCFLKGI